MSLINFQALGCRLNEAEIEQWSQEYQSKGHDITTDPSEADLIVFNSCAVTAQADKKSKKLINRLHTHNPEAKLVVTGCHATLNPDKVTKSYGADLAVLNQQKEQLVDLSLEQFNFSNNEKSIDAQQSIFKRGKQRAFIKVQDGCRYRCTFCIVTIARGEEHSRDKRSIINEINNLHSQGVQECVLTGVHVGGYGSDIGSNLFELIYDILDQTAIPRVRLASVEPWDLPPEFFTLFDNNRLMPHMHLPIQSGADSVLRRMARRCKTTEFRALVDNARHQVENFNITSDVIVGFPGETEQEWQDSMRFLESIQFGGLHIFTYSPREGTKAARLPDQVPTGIKKARSKELHALEKEQKKNVLSKLVGQSFEVMWENETALGSNKWQGYTPHFHKVVSENSDLKSSQISQVTLSQYDEDNQLLFARSVNSVALKVDF